MSVFTAGPVSAITTAPTTAKPKTAAPTTAKPKTAAPTTAKPKTAAPTTAKPKTAAPTTARPATTAATTIALITKRVTFRSVQDTFTNDLLNPSSAAYKGRATIINTQVSLPLNIICWYIYGNILSES